MHDRNYLIIMAITGIALSASLIYLAKTTDAFTSKTVVKEEIEIPAFEAIPEQTIDCRLCHKQPENLTRHIAGGNYCAACHGTELHDLHKKEKFTCNICHGDPVTIPKKLPEHVICDTCHGYPDPLLPSYGNLITIHITKGHTCDLCHIQDLQSLHKSESYLSQEN